MHIRELLRSKKGFSIRWYSIVVLIIIILLLLLALSLSRYFKDKEIRDSQAAIQEIITPVTQNSDIAPVG